MQKFLADDILIGIGRRFVQPQIPLFFDRQNLQGFFHERKQLFPILEVMEFRQVGSYYESEGLDQAYNNLLASGLLVARGSNLEQYRFTPACAESFRQWVMYRFTPEELRQINRLSSDFRARFSD
jgi:hypothetical protein